MKPILTFVLGVALAAMIAVIMAKRSGPIEEQQSPVATADSALPAAEAAPEPVTIEPMAEPVAEPASEPPARRVARRSESRPAPRQAPPSTTAPVRRPEPRTQSQPPHTKQQEPEANPQPTVTSQPATATPGGPPQSTIHMPPPPGSQPIAETKPAPPPRVPKTVTIPSGTLLAVRIDKTLTSDSVQPGDSFPATLDQPLVVDGAVLAERGARVEGRILEADRGGRVRGSATLALELIRLNTSDGQRVRLQTESFTRKAEGTVKKDATKIGIGAGLGAAIGAVIGGGKGATIGAATGGAAGTGAVLGTRGEAAEIPAETRMTFRLSEAITVTEKLK